jgi:membrane protein implicated in regulation of membrane protease activity
MDHIAEAFASGSAWSWLVLGLALVIAEVAAPTFWLLWPGLSAIVVGLIATVTGPFDWRIEGLLFAVMSIAFTVAGRRFLAVRKKSPSDAPLLNRRAEQYRGRIVPVAEDFVAGRGRVRVDDTLWSAHAMGEANPVAGETVEVVGVNGTVLRVKAVAQASS